MAAWSHGAWEGSRRRLWPTANEIFITKRGGSFGFPEGGVAVEIQGVDHLAGWLGIHQLWPVGGGDHTTSGAATTIACPMKVDAVAWSRGIREILFSSIQSQDLFSSIRTAYLWSPLRHAVEQENFCMWPILGMESHNEHEHRAFAALNFYGCVLT